MTFERLNIKEMVGYSYGEQPSDLNTIKLNTNENPYPPSASVGTALKNFNTNALRRYPDATAQALREIVGNLHGFPPDHILITNGGDEALRLAVTTFVSPEDGFGVLDPSYSLYPVLAAIQNCRLVSIPATKDWELPDTFSKKLNAEGVHLTCIVNPHAPSGHLTSTKNLAKIAEQLNGVLLIDEAYADFIDPNLNYDSKELIDRFDNVLILRTLSKGYSLAGIRTGYLIGDPSLLEPMALKTKDSYNIGAIAQELSCAALSDQSYAKGNWAKIIRERKRLSEELTILGFEIPESQSNFLLAKPPIDAKKVYERLKEDGVVVRYFNTSRLSSYVRITIGTAEENNRLLFLIQKILA